jgi:muramidase (phage lysozyme)
MTISSVRKLRWVKLTSPRLKLVTGVFAAVEMVVGAAFEVLVGIGVIVDFCPHPVASRMRSISIAG